MRTMLAKSLVTVLVLVGLAGATGLSFRAADLTSGRLAKVWDHWNSAGAVYGVPFVLLGDSTKSARNILTDSVVFSTPVVNPVVWTDDAQYEIGICAALDGLSSTPTRVYTWYPDSTIACIPGLVYKIIYQRAAGDTSNKTVTVSVLGLSASPLLREKPVTMGN